MAARFGRQFLRLTRVQHVLPVFALMSIAATALANETAAPVASFRYSTVGIKAGDQLAIREKPGATEKVVGYFAFDAKRIVVTGRKQQLSTNGKIGAVWWEILLDGRSSTTGWVHSRFMKLEPTKDGWSEDEGFGLTCAGTEPFWDVDFSRTTAKFGTPEGDDNKQLSASPWIMAKGLRGQFAIRLDDPNTRLFGYFSVLTATTHCTDHMSDNDYPYHATLIKNDGLVLGGCCYRSGISEAPVRRD